MRYRAKVLKVDPNFQNVRTVPHKFIPPPKKKNESASLDGAASRSAVASFYDRLAKTLAPAGKKWGPSDGGGEQREEIRETMVGFTTKPENAE